MENDYYPGDHYPFPVPGLLPVQVPATGHETAPVAAAFLFLDVYRTPDDLPLYFFIGAADQVAVPGSLSIEWQPDNSAIGFPC